jgi:putative CocE/NonD family hydrolase
MKRPHLAANLVTVLLLALSSCAAPRGRSPGAVTATTQPAWRRSPAGFIRSHYTKSIYRIPMRDGVRLFTVVYSPRDTSQAYPILMVRTPYSVGPYGKNEFPGRLGPSSLFPEEGYIFVYQDVRGCFMSEGTFENVRPHLEQKSKPTDIDESTDARDTIDYLLKNVPNHNGRVGMWGISYPGFYCSAGMIDAHPALKAVSPQAPVSDWFFDDFLHHGAFFLTPAFNFLSGYGRPRPAPTTQRAGPMDIGTPDGYQFFLDLGSLKNVETHHFHGEITFWTQITQHPGYDAFWQARNILPHLRHVAPGVLVVGGWFDAEDLYGTLNTYQAIERQNPGVTNTLVMGPWRHGGWSGGDGQRLGNIDFGSKTAEFYRKTIELPFFNHHLKDKGDPKLPEAYVFETGRNQWRTFGRWPPNGVREKALYIHAGGRLLWEASPASRPSTLRSDEVLHDAYVSDPAKPVPYTEAITRGFPPEYMVDDQRFAARRPDVLVYQTEPLCSDVTLAGPIVADLWVSTSAGDADWIVKLIDVYPPGAKDYNGMTPGRRLGGYQMMIRSEVIRGRFREDNTTPKPFMPNEPTRVHLPLLDVLHTFLAGHRIMVQIQSTWFPLVDRNPQKYVVNIFQAGEGDFIKATHRVYHDGPHPTRLRVCVLE